MSDRENLRPLLRKRDRDASDVEEEQTKRGRGEEPESVASDVNNRAYTQPEEAARGIAAAEPSTATSEGIAAVEPRNEEKEGEKYEASKTPSHADAPISRAPAEPATHAKDVSDTSDKREPETDAPSKKQTLSMGKELNATQSSTTEKLATSVKDAAQPTGESAQDASTEPSALSAKPKSTQTSSPLPESKPKLGFGAFASTEAPFQSATALSKKAEDGEKKSEGWAGNGEQPNAEAQDIVVRKKEVQKPDVELMTGEEHETTVASARVKLYVMAQDKSWKERGIGVLKINTAEGASPRLVMRSDAVLRLLLNVKLFSGMQCDLEQERFVRVVVMEPQGIAHLALKFGNAQGAMTFLQQLKEHIPNPTS